MEAKLWDWLIRVVVGLGIVVMSAFAWMARRQVSRIDELEKQSVRREEYNQTVQSLRNQINESHQEIKREIHQTRTATTDRLDKIMLHLSNMDKD